MKFLFWNIEKNLEKKERDRIIAKSLSALINNKTTIIDLGLSPDISQKILKNEMDISELKNDAKLRKYLIENDYNHSNEIKEIKDSMLLMDRDLVDLEKAVKFILEEKGKEQNVELIKLINSHKKIEV